MSDFEDGTYVRPRKETPGVTSIYLANVDGSHLRPIMAGDSPAWSPDGASVAFHRDSSVYVAKADGSEERRLATGSSPAWAPDGTQIAFTSATGISVMNADGSEVRTLIRHLFRDDTYAPWDMGVGNADWSPDGKHIAFEHYGDGDTQPAAAFVMNADGSEAHRLSSGTTRYAESDPSWSPDGHAIVLWNYHYGIASVDLERGTPATIYASSTAWYGAKPRVSPDGKTVAFTVHTQSSTPTEIWTVRFDGTNARRLIIGGQDAAWSPDRATIAFVR
jgi:Tol biopolymer transport system component